MKPLHSCVGILCAWAACLMATVTADDAIPPPPPLAEEIIDPDATQDLVLLLNTPIFLRVQLEVDGRPYRQPWRDNIKAIHAAADANSDGSLTPDEVSAALAATDASIETRRLLQDPAIWDFDLLPVDGQLSGEELVLSAESRFGGAFQQATQSTATVVTQDMSMYGASGRAPGEVLFESLDADRDDRLTVEEVEIGGQSLRRLDFDADGNASLSEMEYTRNPFMGQTQFGVTGESVPVMAIDRSRPLTEAVDQLLTKYGDEPQEARGGQSLPGRRLGLPEHVFATYDRDGNGSLDRRELKGLLEDPPVWIVLRVRVGQREPDEPMVEVRSTAAWNDVVVRTNPAGIVSLLAEGSQIEVVAGQSTPTQLNQYFQSIFTAFDRDQNAYLVREELQSPPYDGLFDQFDVNHDGMVYADEMLAVVDAESSAAFSRSRMMPANRGRDFFEILDENHDRRINPRELRVIIARMDIWDADDDNAISQQEIPQLYQLTFDRGQPEFPGLFLGGGYTVTAYQMGPTPATTSGPIWFQRMDRNDDGDVSRREFLGTGDQFAALDVDGDDLISPQEAFAQPDRPSDAAQ